LVRDIGRRREERRKERRNIVGLKHMLTPGESIDMSHKKGQRVTALGNY